MKNAWPESWRSSAQWKRGALGLSVLALSLAAAPSAHAQTKEELDKARTLFQEGVALSAANNCAAALTKYRAVAKVKMTAQVAFNIAECEERLGKLVSALGNYRLAASQAQGDPKAKDVASRVGDRIDAIEPRIPKLIVKRGKNADTVAIELDGSELGASQLSAEIPVDPGSHTVVAKLGDKEYSHDTVTIAEKESKTFEVKLDNLPRVKLDKANVDEPPPPDPDKDKAPPPPPPKSKVPGIVALTVGGLGAVLGGAFIGLRGGTISDLDKVCMNGVCPPSAESTANKGKLYTGLAEGSFVVGLAGIVTGVVLLVQSSAKPKPMAAPAAGLVVSPPKRVVKLVPDAPGATVGGLSVVGSF